MAKKIMTEEQAYQRYHQLYTEGRESYLRYAVDSLTGETTNYGYRMYYTLGDTEQRLGQIIPSVKAFAESDYNKALKRWERKLERWEENGEQGPKPSKPHRDSFVRYLDKFARHQTRQVSPAQAAEIVKTHVEESYVLDKNGEKIPIIDKKTGEQKIDPETGEPLYKIRRKRVNNFPIEYQVKVPIIDKETKQQKIDPETGELLYTIRTKKRKPTLNDVYYGNPDDAEKFFWDPIRKRRAQLIKEQRELGEDGLTGGALLDYLYKTIAREYFDSP